MELKKENNIEFLAKLRADEKEALYILKKMRYYAEIGRTHKTDFNTHKLEMWEAKADELLRNRPDNEKINDPTKNFKSILEQYKEGLFYERKH